FAKPSSAFKSSLSCRKTVGNKSSQDLILPRRNINTADGQSC
ncbi:hypothetical protein Tco_0495254, partial [Tanacetum coccineum]